MNISKAVKKIAALGTGVTLLGATMFGAMAADLNQYPAPFVKDGKFNGIVVVGDSALAADTIGATDILVSLQKASVSTTSVNVGDSGTTITVEGDAVKV
jgi:S-layer protein (TIGR01564 family)